MGASPVKVHRLHQETYLVILSDEAVDKMVTGKEIPVHIKEGLYIKVKFDRDGKMVGDVKDKEAEDTPV